MTNRNKLLKKIDGNLLKIDGLLARYIAYLDMIEPGMRPRALGDAIEYNANLRFNIQKLATITCQAGGRELNLDELMNYLNTIIDIADDQETIDAINNVIGMLENPNNAPSGLWKSTKKEEN